MGYTQSERGRLREAILEFLAFRGHVRISEIGAWFERFEGHIVDPIERDMVLNSLLNEEKLRRLNGEFHFIPDGNYLHCQECQRYLPIMAFTQTSSGGYYTICKGCMPKRISSAQKQRHAKRKAAAERKVLLDKLMGEYTAGIALIRTQLDRNTVILSTIMQMMADAA